MNEYRRVFPGRLEHARKVLGVSWKELALRSQIPLSILGEFAAANRVVPCVTILCRLADALNVSTDYLAGHSDYLLDPAKVQFVPKEKSQ